MKKFSWLFDQIDQTHSTNEKVAYIEAYFRSTAPEDSVWTLYFLSGQRLKRVIGPHLLLDWCMQVTNTPEWLVEECYAAVGDTAELISLLLNHKSETNKVFDITFNTLMQTHVLPLAKKTKDEQKKLVVDLWSQLNSKEIFILNKILTGNFRVGVSQLLTLKALAQALNVPREFLSQRVMGYWQPTKEFFESLSIVDIENKYLNPYPFYLASPLEDTLETLGSPLEWRAEWKWDGIRAQAVHRKGKTAIWSRGNELITEQFPDLVEALKKLPDGTVLDGEILAFKDNIPLCFGSLQKRLGRKKPSKAIQHEVPVVFMAYDLLELNHEDLRKEPLQIRINKLLQFEAIDPSFKMSAPILFQDWQEIYDRRLQAKDMHTEGLMLKKLNSTYGVGRERGNWWKYKVNPMTIDAVLLYAQAGTGKRANLYTDYTFGIWHEKELIPIAKAYSGLNQEEIHKLDNWIRHNTMEKFGPVRKVKAELVFELAFEGIQVSARHKSGVALRFPRIARWREDKPMEECDTLEQIKTDFLH